MPAFLSQFGQGGLSILLLAGTAVCWYIAVRAAATALRSRATGILIAGAAPAVAGTAWLSASGRTETAVALALGTAMASATLVLGLVCNITPTEGKPLRDDPSRRLKATLLPVTVTFLIAAFAGVLHLLHGLLLVAEAGIILWLWNLGFRAIPSAAVAPATVATAPPTTEAAPPDRREVPGWLRGIQLLLALALAVAGAGFATGAATAASHMRGDAIDVGFASLLVAAVLALPLIGIGTAFAAEGDGPAVQRGLALTVVAMLTIAIPVAIGVETWRQVSATGLSEQAALSWWHAPPGIPLLLRFWRVDAVLLCLVGLLLLPSAAGRFRLGHVEGIGLIVVYVAYIAITLATTR